MSDCGRVEASHASDYEMSKVAEFANEARVETCTSGHDESIDQKRGDRVVERGEHRDGVEKTVGEPVEKEREQKVVDALVLEQLVVGAEERGEIGCEREQIGEDEMNQVIRVEAVENQRAVKLVARLFEHEQDQIVHL